MPLDIEKIESNWNTFENLCNKICDDNLTVLLDTLSDRIASCPASSKESQYGAYHGGLVEHSLKVTMALRSVSDSHELNLPIRSILLVGLLHDIGKIGDLDNENFVYQDSEWHREKLGQMFKFNEDTERMSTSHRTLFLLQHFGISLTKDEWIAIQLAQGAHFEENRFYTGNEPTLAIALQHAKSMCVHLERN